MNHQASEWEHGNVIACYAPDHNVMCFDCLGTIEAGDMFHVHHGRPTHIKCPRQRHLHLVSTPTIP